MHARDLLLQRQTELKESISTVEEELSEIARALVAMSNKPTGIGQATPRRDLTPPPPPPSSPAKHPMLVNDAIIIAVGDGMKTPTQILAYLDDNLGVKTTLNSVRSRVSPLGQQGLIGRDKSGWIPAVKGGQSTMTLNENGALNGNSASAPEAGEAPTSPEESEAEARRQLFR